MHTIDGGVLKYAFYQIVRQGYGEKENWKYVRPPLKADDLARYIAVLSDAFDVFRKCLPSDYARQPRNPSDAAHDYKTAEVRVAATRFLPALLLLPRVKPFMTDGGLTKNFMNLLVFCRLINHFSTKPMKTVRYPEFCLICFILSVICRKGQRRLIFGFCVFCCTHRKCWRWHKPI
jgi:hypothetical protein